MHFQLEIFCNASHGKSFLVKTLCSYFCVCVCLFHVQHIEQRHASSLTNSTTNTSNISYRQFTVSTNSLKIYNLWLEIFNCLINNSLYQASRVGNGKTFLIYSRFCARTHTHQHIQCTFVLAIVRFLSFVRSLSLIFGK
jgi:hypothetical protein